MTSNLSLEEVARRLDRAGIPWAVFAGAAASAYGATRPLTDVDILVPSTEGNQVAALFPEGEIKRGEDGLAKLTLDGSGPIYVDLHGNGSRETVWTSGALTDGVHTLKIEWSGLSNSDPTWTWINISAIEVIGSVLM